MLLTIRNLSTDAIIGHTPPTQTKFHIQRDKGAVDEFLLQPSASVTTSLSKGCKREIIIRHSKSEVDVSADAVSATALIEKEEWHIHPESFKIRFSLELTSSWQLVDVPRGCPWRVYVGRITRKHHSILILSRRNLGSFLSELPDGLPLSSTVLPG
ncbi:hypothetical protein BDN70DRAFT_871897 [Pholiota conissans]|uniref:Uncharacterized protein n=1 Tax=Pholiota conissans TaxID=109636 RepID=A0A9P6D5U8_9AGAR|nr:hypothetical protein BDN70DRAFT_871897 [Pholiota conissans]